MRSRYYWMLMLMILCLPAWADEPAPQQQPPSPGKSIAEIGPKPKPIEPPTAEAIEQSIHRGLEFLLKTQQKDGSWGSANITRPDEIYAPVPGAHHAFKAAVTAMCISALIETGGDRKEIQESLDRAEEWLFKNLSKVRRQTPDALYNIWTHTYGIQALVRMLDRKPGDAGRARRIKELIEHQIGMLDRYETIDGGWFYYEMKAQNKKPSGPTASFVTAAVLVALHEAKMVGVEVPSRLIERAEASIIRQRKPDFTYDYGEYLKNSPMRPINRPGGSLGRSQACNAAMRLWGNKDTTDAIIKTWLDRLFARNMWLDIGRKRPIPHEAWFQVAGYFFYFGHYYAGRCIDILPEKERAPFQDQMAFVLLRLQEKDGSWWDYPLYDYHQQYGTAFALMTLHRTQKSAK
jgi:hypothetical protein